MKTRLMDWLPLCGLTDLTVFVLQENLTDILGPGAGDDEGPAAGLLRHPVIIHLPVEGLPVLLPSVAESIAEFKYFKYLNIL